SLRQSLSELSGRHSLAFFNCGDTAVKLAFVEFAHNNNRGDFAVIKDPLFGVEAELALSLILVWTMAGETIVRQDGADISVEFDDRWQCIRCEEARAKEYHRNGGKNPAGL